MEGSAVPLKGAAKSGAIRPRVTRLRESLALVAVALVAWQRPFPVVSGGAVLGYVMYSDAPLILLIGSSVGGFLYRLRTRSFGRPSLVCIAVVAFWCATLLSAVLHPVWFGFVSVVRLGGACLIGGVVATMVRERRFGPVSAVPVAWLAFQLPIGLLQYLRGETLGLEILGESSDSFRLFEGVTAASGTLTHRNTFAVLGCAVGAVLVGLGTTGLVRWLHWFGSAAAGCIVGLGVSRTGAVSVVLVGMMVSVGGLLRRSFAGGRVRARQGFALWVTMSAGLAVGVVLQWTAWSSRVAAVGTRSDLDGVSSGRLAIMRQAVAVWKLDPVFGVGPNRYLLPVLNDPTISAMSTQKVPVHNLWLFVLASTGIVGAVCLGVLTLLIGWRAWKAGVAAFIIVGALMPGLMLDVAMFIWSGSLVLAFALGTICGLTSTRKLALSETNPPS
jgi:O-Antigen ligase